MEFDGIIADSLIERAGIMETLQIIINVLMLIAAILLVIVILVQNPKNSGLGGAFGGETTRLGQERKMKATKETKLQRLTIAFAVILGVLAIVMLILSGIARTQATK